VKGICHHDIKPENIVVSREGIPKIVDFNISGISYENESTIKTVQTN